MSEYSNAVTTKEQNPQWAYRFQSFDKWERPVREYWMNNWALNHSHDPNFLYQCLTRDEYQSEWAAINNVRTQLWRFDYDYAIVPNPKNPIYQDPHEKQKLDYFYGWVVPWCGTFVQWYDQFDKSLLRVDEQLRYSIARRVQAPDTYIAQKKENVENFVNENAGALIGGGIGIGVVVIAVAGAYIISKIR